MGSGSTCRRLASPGRWRARLRCRRAASRSGVRQRSARYALPALRRRFEAAGLRHHERNRYTLDSLRRYAAKGWLGSGLNIRQVQLLLGHECLQAPILYLNHDLEKENGARVAQAPGSLTGGLCRLEGELCASR